MLSAEAASPSSLSVVVPVHDEAPSLSVLHAELCEVLDGLERPAEIVFVDDGSTDASADVVRQLMARDPRVRLVRLRRNAGLTAALAAGFAAARGTIVVTLDGDLQNDPRDIPPLLAALEGADAVIGWRQARRDPWLRRASSRIANAIRDLLTGDGVRDSGSGLRAIRRECLCDLPRVNGIHRFIPTVLQAAGRRVVQVPVSHRARRFGRSHFGIRNRAAVAFLDLLAIRWMVSRRLLYDAVEEAAVAAAEAPRIVPSESASTLAPSSGRHVARQLAAFWLATAVLVGAAGVLPGRYPTSDVAPGTTELTLFQRRPSGSLIALWLHWDAPPGIAGWAIIESARGWSASAEAYWQRRIHPGWNYLVWPELWTLPADEPVRLRLAEGAGAAWHVAAPRVDARYGFHHLTQFRGLLVAIALATVVGVARAAVSATGSLRAGYWWLAVAGVSGLALWLRAYTVTLQSLWFDEVLTAIGSQNLAWVVHTPQIFGHPPLQYLTSWLVGGSAADEWWLRLPSLVAGVATVAGLAALGRRLFGPATGLLAGFALAVSPLHVEIAQLARPYALFLLFTVLSLGALIGALDRGRARDWLWFSVLLTLNLYTHYLALQVFALEAVTAIVFMARARWRGGLAVMLSFGGALVLLLPWAPVLRRLGAAQLGHGDLPASLLHELMTRVFAGQFLGHGTGTLIGVGLMACALWSLRRRPDLVVVTLAWIALPLVLLWLAQPAHFIAGRHLAFTLPVVMLLLGPGVVTVAEAAARAVKRLGGPRRLLPPLAAAVAAAGVLITWGVPAAEGLRYYYQGRMGADWRTVASVLDRLIAEEDQVVATVGAVYPLRYYWKPRVEDIGAAGFPGPPRVNQQRCWVVTHEGRDRPPGLTAWLQAYAIKVGEVPISWSLPGLEIYRLRRTNEAQATGTAATRTTRR